MGLRLHPPATAYLPCAAHSPSDARTALHILADAHHLAPQTHHLLSRTCRQSLAAASPRLAKVAVDGTHGGGLCVVRDRLALSVEAAALVTWLDKQADGVCPPVASQSYAAAFSAHTANGWRGLVTGQALQYVLYDECDDPPYPLALLRDRYAAALQGAPDLTKLAWEVQEHDWHGAPDLLAWRGDQLVAIEVKTPTDRLKAAQRDALCAVKDGVLLRVVRAVE